VSNSRTVAASGVAALLIALSIIALISLSGVPAARLSSTSSSGTPSGGTVLTTETTLSPNEGGSTITSTSSSQGQESENQGVISVLMTDPPRVPAGLTAIYAYYIGLAVHGAGGWTTVMVAGEIELMGTVDVAQTLASATVPAGTYDAVRFNLSSAVVTYEGVNYTAVVQGDQLTVRIGGGTVVSPSQQAAAIIDMQPTIVNMGTSSGPQFILWANARAFPVPPTQVNEGIEVEGHRLSLTGIGWWDNDMAQASASLQLSAVSLSVNSLGITVADTGSTGTSVRMVVVSDENLSMGITDENPVPDQVIGSAVFVVLKNGTMIQFHPLLHISTPQSGDSQSSAYDALQMAGYNLSAGASVHFSYSGTINLSFGLVTLPKGITSGTTYWVTVIGDDAVTSTQVTAG